MGAKFHINKIPGNFHLSTHSVDVQPGVSRVRDEGGSHHLRGHCWYQVGSISVYIRLQKSYLLWSWRKSDPSSLVQVRPESHHSEVSRGQAPPLPLPHHRVCHCGGHLHRGRDHRLLHLLSFGDF